MSVWGWLIERLAGPQRDDPETPVPQAQGTWHVIVLDGTMSSFRKGYETNAGLIAKLAREKPYKIDVYYEPGIQYHGMSSVPKVLFGRGLGDQIRRAYGVLASRYRPGDHIVLVGYSRGAFAVRSLAGMIHSIGLLKSTQAQPRHIRQVWRGYKGDVPIENLESFRNHMCHIDVTIDAIAAFDTVRALGVRLPLIWRMFGDRYAFHDHHLSACVKHAYHALAYNETRLAYSPIKWDNDPPEGAQLMQMWFAGAHGDVGGHLSGFEAARGLSNIPLTWMIEQLQSVGLPLPENSIQRFKIDPHAPSVGTWSGVGKWLLVRKKRIADLGEYEMLHPTLEIRQTQDTPDEL